MPSFALWDHYSRSTSGDDASLTDQLLTRTAGFDKYDQLDDQQRARLEVEYWRRIQYWTDSTRAGVRWASAASFAVSASVLVVIGALATLAILGEGWLLPVFAAILFAICWGTRARFGRQRRLHRTLTSGACPDCAYDLTGSLPAIEPSIFGGQSVGPRTCPECGVPWPLLPAAMPGSEFSPV